MLEKRRIGLAYFIGNNPQLRPNVANYRNVRASNARQEIDRIYSATGMLKYDFVA